MLNEELVEAAQRGDKEEVARMVDEEGTDANSTDMVRVCVLCLLILVLFGIAWKNCSHLVFLQRPLGGGTRAIGSRSESNDQDQRK